MGGVHDWRRRANGGSCSPIIPDCAAEISDLKRRLDVATSEMRSLPRLRARKREREPTADAAASCTPHAIALPASGRGERARGRLIQPKAIPGSAEFVRRRNMSRWDNKPTQMPTGSRLRAAVVFELPDSVAGILPLGYEYVPVAILGQRADVRHQPVSTRNSELVGDRAIEDLPSRFDSHLRILVDSELPLGIC
ncbi:hypothetical protein ABIC09_002478 [Bradyrhizobium sp. S3.12.5]